MAKFRGLFALFVLPLFGHKTRGHNPVHLNVLDIACKRDFIQVNLHVLLSTIKWLQDPRLQIHLTDPKCKPVFANSTHVTIQAPLDRCATRHRDFGDSIIYYNRIIFTERLQPGQVVPRMPEIKFPVQCVYGRETNLINSQTPVLKSLRIDRSASSARVRPHVQGIPLTLKCMFRYGAPPISSVMMKRDRKSGSTRSVLVVRGNRQLSVVLDMKRDSDFRGYYCQALDARNDKVTHEIQLIKVDPANATTDGITVTCSKEQSRMRVDLDRSQYPWISPIYFHLHLRDPGCEIRHINKTQMSIVIPLEHCGTRRRETYHQVLYSNELRAHTFPGSGIKVSDLRIPVRCQYRRTPQSRIQLTSDRHLLPVLSSSRTDIRNHANETTYCLYRLGETVRAVCHVDKYDKFIGWHLSSTENVSKTGDRVKMEGNKLIIKRLHINDAGKYLCRTKYTNLSLYIYIEAKVSAPGIQYLARDSSGSINCSLSGFPTPVVSWVKDGKTLSHIRNGYIKINDVTSDDAGVYTCTSKQIITRPKRLTIRQSTVTTVKVHEKLSLDEQRSSPSVVRTFRGFRTRLSCSFTRGVPPIVVTLIKGGRTIGRTQNRNVDGALEMYVTSFGRYTCMATDLSGVTVRHNIEVKQARPQYLINHGMNVLCVEGFMVVRFNRLLYPWLDSRNLHMHLIDPNCNNYSIAGKWLTVRVPLSGCGTESSHQGDVIKYFNTFVCHVVPGPGMVISRVPDVWFPFNCTYGGGELSSSIDVLPIGRLRIDDSRSSPKVLRALVGMKVTINCVLLDGVPPYEISLRRRGRILRRERVSRRRKLSVVVTARRRNLGTYTCKAVDAIGRTTKREIILTKTELSEISYRKLGVECYTGHIFLTLDRQNYPWIHPDHMSIHLKDDTCKPFYFNRTHVLLKVPLTRCGTRFYQTRNFMVYYNTLIVRERLAPGQVISRLPVIEFPFKCEYTRRGMVAGER